MGLVWESLDPRLPLKMALAKALKDSGISREHMVDRLNQELAEAGISLKATLPKLEKWVAPSSLQHIIPAYAVPAFCKITGSRLPLQALAQPLGLHVADGQDQAAMRAGYALASRRKANRQYNNALTDLEDLL